MPRPQELLNQKCQDIPVTYESTSNQIYLYQHVFRFLFSMDLYLFLGKNNVANSCGHPNNTLLLGQKYSVKYV